MQKVDNPSAMAGYTRYAITIAYDGTDYCGWQAQPGISTIIQTIQDAFQETFGVTIKLIGASRTDAGVHAYGQVAVFDLPKPIDSIKMLRGWNNALPGNIFIRSLRIVDPSFYPRHHVDYKIYHYHFFTTRPLPFVARYGTYVQHHVNHDKLKAALQLFVGTHDFKLFCTHADEKSTTKTIDAISLQYIKRYNMFRIVVKGESFLHHMIRRIVGAALYVASYKSMQPEIVNELLAGNDVRKFPVAPAQGLMLRKIRYRTINSL